MSGTHRKRGVARLVGVAPGAAMALLLAMAGQASAGGCSPADLNGDGIVDFSDYLEFLDRYDAADLSVDYTADGIVDFSDYLEFLNLYEAGCGPSCSTTSAQLAATPLAAFPFADRSNTFLNTSIVYASVDPFLYPSLTGKTTNVYITTNRTWASGDTLTDVRGSAQSVTWAGGTILANTVGLTNSTSLASDAGEDVGVAYDIVIDENNNGVFDACDFVDGAGAEAGFYKIKDLTTVNASTPITQINTVSIPAGRCAAGFEDERWYYPADIAGRGQIPLIIISHGNGHNYTWYDHLGTHLASYGYIVITHENNTATGDGVPSASTTLLDHYNTIIALQGSLAGGVLAGHIKQSETYWIGHSRGGECVAYGWDRLNKGLYTPTGGFPRVINSADVKYVQSIAPVDFAGGGRAVGGGTAFTDAGPTDFMLLYGSSDGDVTGGPGNPNVWSFDVLERADARRNSVYIQGVGHNEFNCCGFADATGPDRIGRPAAQAIQKIMTLASIKSWREGNIPCREVITRQYETFKAGSTLSTAVVDLEYKDFGASRKFVIDDFQTQASTAVSSSGGAVSGTVTNRTEGLLRDANSSYNWSAADPMNGMSRARSTDSTAGAVFDYDTGEASRDLTFDIVAAGRDTTPYSFLSFRACQGTQHPFTQAVLGDQSFEVELEDAAGQTSRIRISAYGGGVEEVYQRVTGGVAGWANEFETIRIPLSDFLAEGRNVDLTNIAKVRFLFGSAHGTSQGRLGLDDVEFTK